MNSSSLEKKKSTSKNSGGNVKKNHPRIEAVKVTVERKKKCNDKALQIVTDFSEGTISEDRLLDSLKFINQEHYQDIVEERAINKLCGYPLCSKILKNIPQKQFHISTTLNKVFDITERKNFCSNLCFKASKFLKDQVSTSPLWLREDDSSTSFTLISLQSSGGMTGDEVDLGVSPVKLEFNEVLSSSTTVLNDNSDLELATNESSTKERHELSVNESNNSSIEQSTLFDENKIKCSTSENPLCNNSSQSKTENSNEEIVFGFNDKKRNGDLIYETSAQSNNSEKCLEGRDCQASDVIIDTESLSCSNPSATKEENHTLPSVTSNSPTQNNVTESHKQNNVIESHKHSSKRKSLKPRNKTSPANTNPIQNVVLKIEQILREWISIDSLCFVLGEDKIKEILAEKKDQNLPGFTQDVHFYERYLAICKKLNVLELEETKIDASYRDETRKPLPDYEALKEEARQMEIKVKMFFKGDKVRFEETELSGEVKSKSEEVEPVLPLVDVHAQKALRRRIVIDKLRKVLQDLQKSLGLRGFNLTEDLRTLVSTLTLSAHNITMKPAEWNLVAIAVIKLLSLRDNLLAQALNSSMSKKHLTLLLMSYTLDSGYLDRLMVWLTDVEAVLQKT